MSGGAGGAAAREAPAGPSAGRTAVGSARRRRRRPLPAPPLRPPAPPAPPGRGPGRSPAPRHSRARCRGAHPAHPGKRRPWSAERVPRTGRGSWGGIGRVSCPFGEISKPQSPDCAMDPSDWDSNALLAHLLCREGCWRLAQSAQKCHWSSVSLGSSATLGGYWGSGKKVLWNRRPPGGACPGSSQLGRGFLLRRAGSAGFNLRHRFDEHLLSSALGPAIAPLLGDESVGQGWRSSEEGDEPGCPGSLSPVLIFCQPKRLSVYAPRHHVISQNRGPVTKL